MTGTMFCVVQTWFDCLYLYEWFDLCVLMSPTPELGETLLGNYHGYEHKYDKIFLKKIIINILFLVILLGMSKLEHQLNG